MAWSYLQDESDMVVSSQGGPAVVEGQRLPQPARSAVDAQEQLDPKKKEKRLEDNEKFKKQQWEDAQTAPEREQEGRDRERIRTEERNRLVTDEKNKKLDEMRKEEADKAKKAQDEQQKKDKEEEKPKSEGPKPQTAAPNPPPSGPPQKKP